MFRKHYQDRGIRLFRSGLTAFIIMAVLIVPAWAVIDPGETRPALAAKSGRTAAIKADQSFGHQRLCFEANHGQTDSRVKFLSRGQGYTLFLTPAEAVLALRRNQPGPDISSELTAKPQQPVKSKSAVLRMRLVGANPSSHLTGLEELPGKVNYLLGRDRKKWRTNLPTYAKVRCPEVYPGIDLVYYGASRCLEFDFIVAPGAEPKNIRLAFQGAEKISLDKNGDLVLETKNGRVIHRAPVVYQEIDGRKQKIAGRFTLGDRHEVGFQLASYDRAKPLVIDPVLVYSTYLGGAGNDGGGSVALDGSGNIYVAGSAASADFPTADPFQAGVAGNHDAFVTKFNPSGAALVYSTYLGGGADDSGYSVAVDSSGAAYVTGVTASDDFPTVNAFQGGLSTGDDAFVAKLSPSGSELLYSTYLGGNNTDRPYAGLVINPSGQVYVAGWAASTDFPTKNSFQDSDGSKCFLAKLDPSNAGEASLIFSTYFGGGGVEGIFGVEVCSSGYIYVAGHTSSTTFPTLNAYQGQYSGGNYDLFLSKFNPDASALVYSTYLGGSDIDMCKGLAVDSNGNPYLAGYTYSHGFPTRNPYQGQLAGGDHDCFVTKFNSDASALVYSTYLGGSDNEICEDIIVDSSGHAYVTGGTHSNDFPVQSAVQSELNGPRNAFVTKLSSSGTSLVYSTYLGGGSGDKGWGLALDSSGNLYVSGETASEDFPTASPFQASFGGDQDAFVAKLGTAPATDSHFVTIPGGSTAASFFMLGTPLQLDQPAFEDVLGSQIGVYDESRMQIGYWDAIHQVYVEYPDFSGEMHPGWSGWFLFVTDQTLNFTGTVTPSTRGASGVLGYAITLYEGWNQLANPHNFNVAPDEVVVRDSTGGNQYLTDASNTITQQLFWVWVSGAYSATTNLTPGTGGWLKKLTAGQGEIIFPPIHADVADQAPQSLDTEGLDQPPAPPSAFDSSQAASGGGGGGGCFIGAASSGR